MITTNTDSNGWVGLNPSLARTNIDNFYDKCMEALNVFSNSTNNLFNGLLNTWASPKAVEFSKKYSIEIENLISNFQNEAFSKARDAANAYNSVAYAHGASSVGYVGGSSVPNMDLTLNDNKNGVVGMNIDLVKNDILPEFVKNANNAIDSINQIPTSLALYDDNNGIRHYFSSNISGFKSKFENLTNDLIVSINQYIDDETLQIQQSKQAAIEALSNSTGGEALGAVVSSAIASAMSNSSTFDKVVTNKSESPSFDISNLKVDGVNVKPGEIIDIKADWGGTLYKVYVPENVNKDTNIIVFYPGTDGIEHSNDSKVVLDYINSNKPESIMFMSYGSGGSSAQSMNKNVKNIMNSYEFNNESITVFGFSRGAEYGEKYARQSIESGVNVKNLILIDPANDGSTLEWQTNVKAASVLKNANTNVTVFSHNGDGFMNSYSYRYASSTGLNINVVNTVKGHNQHTQINRELVENGSLDFFVKAGDLKNINYYQVKDSNGWRAMNQSDADKLR